MGILVCWCWRLCREVQPGDSNRTQSPRAQGCAPTAQRSQIPLWNRSWCTFFFPSITDPSKSSTTCRAAPLSERGAARLLSETLLLTLWVIYLLLGSESPTPSTLFLPALCYSYFFTSAKSGSLQILSAPSQQITHRGHHKVSLCGQ